MNATMVMVNSTISGNVADQDGGGISHSGNSISLQNVTVAANSSPSIGAISGGFKISNTIVASTAGTNCFGPPITSLGHNLDSDGTCNFSAPGDLSDVDPLLGPLFDNGGPTQTHALLAGSPGIDDGDEEGCPPTDQRGVVRPQGSACDIGAFEVQVATPAPTASPTSTPVPCPASPGCQPLGTVVPTAAPIALPPGGGPAPSAGPWPLVVLVAAVLVLSAALAVVGVVIRRRRRA